MGTIDLRELDGDKIVIHFGGALTSVDAYTFANSLVAFADTIRSVNGVIDPGQNIEVRVEALGPGSFRAVVKRVRKGLGGLFAEGVKSVIWGIIAALIYENLIKGESGPNIVVNTDEVVIEVGGDKVIIPREVYEQMPRVRTNPEVQRNLRRTFEVIEQDEAVQNFGLTPHIDDREPLVQVPRSDFSSLSAPVPIVEGDASRRERTEPRARLVIIKAWLRPGHHKWSFEWNGVPISAIISDKTFLERLARREFLIGAGDALDARLKYQQQFDTSIGTYVNDMHTFEIVEVLALVPRGGGMQDRLGGT